MDASTAQRLALVKVATSSSLLKGQLYLSQSGFLLLAVPNAIGRGLFAALREPGAELPVSETDGQYNAHVTVMRDDEVAKIGPTKITERGHEFSYSLGRVRDFNPLGWAEMNHCWVVEVKSPELEKLRKSYGLPPVPVHHTDGRSLPFHITFAVRRSGVLGDNETSKPHAPVGERESKPLPWDKPGTQVVKTGADEVTLNQLVARAARKAVEPKSDAQADAGNYRKGHVHMHGLRVSIENRKGSTRSGTNKAGKTWSVTMNNHYGYICRSCDLDGDHVDVFIGPDPGCELVYVVDQIDPETKKFDEHKALIGFRTLKDAKEAYLSNYENGWQGMGKVTPVTMQQFKEWLADGSQNRPISTQTFRMKKAEDEEEDEDEKKPAILILRRSTMIRFVPPEDADKDEVHAEFKKLLERFGESSRSRDSAD